MFSGRFGLVVAVVGVAAGYCCLRMNDFGVWVRHGCLVSLLIVLLC